MDYNDEYAVRGQIEQLKQEILKYKDHPALLVWGIGNEVDLRYSNFKVWDTIEELAKFIKEVDPNHPSMTVIAGLDPSKAYLIKERCPSVDILGLTAYGSIENASKYIRKYNSDKPYIVSEVIEISMLSRIFILFETFLSFFPSIRILTNYF